MSRSIQSRTKTCTHNKYERGRETIVEKVDGMEGDDISDSDLDILDVVTKEVNGGNTDKYIKGVIYLFLHQLLQEGSYNFRSYRITEIRHR